jgi:hypothetical protein
LVFFAANVTESDENPRELVIGGLVIGGLVIGGLVIG